MSALLAQIGVADEAVFGTIVPPDLFNEFVAEGIEEEWARQRTMNRRPGQLFGNDRSVPYFAGAAGDVELEADSRGFGFWLKHAFGSVVTSAAVDEAFTHTFTPSEAEFNARSMTFQAGRPHYEGGTVVPFTYGGGKVTGWELSASAGENLKATFSLDFATVTTEEALAVTSYADDLETLSWVDANLTVGGVEVDVTEVTISGDNALKTDRRYLRRSTTKKPQVRDGQASGEFSFTADFESLALRDRVKALTSAGVLAELVVTFRGVTPIGAGATVPSLALTLNASLDTWAASASGPEGIMQEISGAFLGSAPIEAVLVSGDATV